MIHPQARFPVTLLKASEYERMQYFSNGFVLRHGHLNRLFENIMREIDWPGDKNICLVAGPTGVGKTTLAQKLIEHFYQGTRTVNSMTMQAVYFEVPQQTKPKFDWDDFFIRLLRAMDEPFPESKLAMANRLTPQHGERLTSLTAKTKSLRRDVETAIKQRSVRWIVLDEISHLFKHTAGKHERNLDVLKSISNITKCHFICVGTYDCLFYVDWSAQLTRRSQLLDFAPYDWAKDQVAFAQAVSGLLAHLPCELEPDLMRDMEFYFLGSVGCIGLLKTWFERALKAFLVSGKKQLSLQILQETRPNNREIMRLIEEIDEGSGFMVAPSDDEVRSRLGLAKASSPPVASKKSATRRVGERAPKRDKVRG